MSTNTTTRPGRPPSGLTPHPVKLYCTDDQWAAYNADREARGMTWGEYVAALKRDSDNWNRACELGLF